MSRWHICNYGDCFTCDDLDCAENPLYVEHEEDEDFGDDEEDCWG